MSKLNVDQKVSMHSYRIEKQTTSYQITSVHMRGMRIVVRLSGMIYFISQYQIMTPQSLTRTTSIFLARL